MNSFFPAEWHPQDAIQLTWPHMDTDWIENFEEAEKCFLEIAKEIVDHTNLVLVHNPDHNPMSLFSDSERKKILFIGCKTNDSWARDHGAITVCKKGIMTAIDFTFNGWGNKFKAKYDDKISGFLNDNQLFLSYSKNEKILEGGSIDSNGEGTIITTENCLLNPNRNSLDRKEDIENWLKKALEINHIIWLKNGDLIGDDTDSHIDTLVRFTNSETLVYCQASETDEHYIELKSMEKELEKYSFNLTPIPLPDPINHEGRRLPATYVNFLITNEKVLLPIYGCSKDKVAVDIITKAFPDKKVTPINCLPIVKQNGSLHCLTMQFPKGSINLSLFHEPYT